jgi:hypothetical protein
MREKKVRGPLWDLWRDGVTSSFIDTYLTCREQCRLVYKEGWTPLAPNLALDFGTAMHWILQQGYSTHYPWMRKKTAPGYVWISGAVQAYQTLWVKQIHRLGRFTPKMQEHVELCMGLISAVVPSYYKCWAGDFTGKYNTDVAFTKPEKWHKLEEVFDVPYTYPDGKVTHLRGRRDAVFIDKRGKHWVFDTKCRSVINHEQAQATQPFDPQQMMYHRATHVEMGKAWPVGTQMNIIRRPAHRRGKNETLAAFISRVRDDVAKPTKFAHNFTRYEMAIRPKEVEQWKKTRLDPIMAEIRMWDEGKIPHYPNDKELVNKYGPARLFAPLTRGDFSECYRRDHVFPELA